MPDNFKSWEEKQQEYGLHKRKNYDERSYVIP
jgi:hypothetical protein